MPFHVLRKFFAPRCHSWFYCAWLVTFLLAGCSRHIGSVTSEGATPTLSQPAASVRTVTPKPTVAPSATPLPVDWVLAAPVPGESYQVNPWTADRAHTLIQDLLQRLDLAEGAEPGQIPDLRQPLRVILQDALWRFPQAAQAPHWRWSYAALQMQNQESAAANLVASLIAAELQTGNTAPDDLPAWLQEKFPQASFTQTVQPALNDQDYRAVLAFASVGHPAYFWVTRQSGAYQVTRLSSGREFQTGAAVQIDLEWNDLTGDAIPEAWVITTDRSRRYEMTALAVYDVSSGIAQRLDFQPALPALQVGSWSIIAENGQPAGLQAALRLDGGDGLCEYLLPVVYRPEGLSYRWAALDPPSLDALTASGLSDAQARLCLDLGVDLLRAYANQGEPLAQAALMDLMPGFPYGLDSPLYLGLYPPDEGDRARFELGLRTALQGDAAGTRHWMTWLIAHPDAAGSPWQGRAQAFLDGYGPAADLRLACLSSQACYGASRLSLNQLVGLMQADDWGNPAKFLQQAGVALQLSGTIDLDQDGQAEFWWIESTGEASDRFWLLAHTQDQPWLGRLTLPAGTGEVSLQPLEPLPGKLVFQLWRGAAELLFVYSPPIPGQPPTLSTLEDSRQQILQSLYQAILAGEDVQDIFQSLKDLQSSSYFGCAQPTDLCQASVFEAYLSALSSELSGDYQASAAAYLTIWRDFSQSSYALLAHARLIDQPSP